MDDPRYAQRYLDDAWVAFIKRKPLFYTHAFLDIIVMAESLIYVLHEALNFSDSPCPIVVCHNRERLDPYSDINEAERWSKHATAYQR